MRVPGDDFANIVVMGRKFKTGARFKLASMFPVKLLPGRMALGVIGLDKRTPAGDLGVVEQNVDFSFAE